MYTYSGLAELLKALNPDVRAKVAERACEFLKNDLMSATHTWFDATASAQAAVTDVMRSEFEDMSRLSTNRLRCVKIVRRWLGCGLKEAMDFLNQYTEETNQEVEYWDPQELMVAFDREFASRIDKSEVEQILAVNRHVAPSTRKEVNTFPLMEALTLKVIDIISKP